MLIYYIQKDGMEGESVLVGINIKKRRMELKMSQQELADAMGYKTRSTIAKIESGENDVSQKKLRKFAEILDTTVESLISGYTMAETYVYHENLDVSKRNRNVVVILAGGKSGRNRQSIPSQYINVHGKPIIVYCMEVYQNYPMIDDIYVVCTKEWMNIVEAYAKQYGISKLRDLIPAGKSGMDSLKNAVVQFEEMYSENDFIIIQEATRPMVTAETISKLLQACSEKGSATICHSMNDYVQFNITNRRAKYVNRDSMIALQSPESHKLELVSRVFKQAENTKHRLDESCFTMLLYNLGYDINFIESTVNNIKITREEDIATFSTLMKE